MYQMSTPLRQSSQHSLGRSSQLVSPGRPGTLVKSNLQAKLHNNSSFFHRTPHNNPVQHSENQRLLSLVETQKAQILVLLDNANKSPNGNSEERIRTLEQGIEEQKQIYRQFKNKVIRSIDEYEKLQKRYALLEKEHLVLKETPCDQDMQRDIDQQSAQIREMEDRIKSLINQNMSPNDQEYLTELEKNLKTQQEIIQDYEDKTRLLITENQFLAQDNSRLKHGQQSTLQVEQLKEDLRTLITDNFV